MMRRNCLATTYMVSILTHCLVQIFKQVFFFKSKVWHVIVNYECGRIEGKNQILQNIDALDFWWAFRAASWVHLEDLYCPWFFLSTHSYSIYVKKSWQFDFFCNICLLIYLFPCFHVSRIRVFSLSKHFRMKSWLTSKLNTDLFFSNAVVQGCGLAGLLPQTNGSSWVSALRQNWTVHRATPHISLWVIKWYSVPACWGNASPTPGLIFLLVEEREAHRSYLDNVQV